MRSVVITGTSTGIGWASAKVLLAHGFRVFGSVRRQSDAERLSKEFGANFVPLTFDVTDEPAVHAAAATVRAALAGETLAGLVNNAGIAVSGPLLELPLADFRRQIDINVIGPVIATQAFGPLLGADRSLNGAPGRIVMISSVAGQNGNPLISPYSTSKHAIEGLSESLRREFMLFGIDVIVIGPGAVKTPIWSKAEEIDISRYGASPFLPALQRLRAAMLDLAATALPVERIGDLVHLALTTPHPRVRYAASPEPGRMLMMKILPKRLLDRIIAKRLGLLPAPRA
ncbi:MAG: SDR family NAD(P)-dependent oxidoreductase [Xanthobacteraceae bacterium]|nr:SDR family NAD(P)-dependent oxidoreductase [Xanthobacteraceae bacterium]